MLIRRTTDDKAAELELSLRHLDWADDDLVSRYRAELPSEAELAKVDTLRATPVDFLSNPNLTVRALENAWGQMPDTWMTAVAEVVDEPTAVKIARTAGRVHGARVLGTFLKDRGDSEASATQLMAEYQDTAHSMRGPRHATALFARYDDRVVEVVRTDDSTGSVELTKAGQQPPIYLAFLDGMVDGYRSVDPALQYVDEIVRHGATGQIEIVHRFWYSPETDA